MIGREKELKELKNAYDSKESQLVAIYGRRRIGKTYLVNEAFNHAFAFHHSGLKRGGVKEQLKQFWMSLRQQGHWNCPKLKDWQEAFFELGNFLSGLPDGPLLRVEALRVEVPEVLSVVDVVGYRLERLDPLMAAGHGYAEVRIHYGVGGFLERLGSLSHGHPARGLRFCDDVDTEKDRSQPRRPSQPAHGAN